MASRRTTPEEHRYNNQYMGDSVSGDESVGSLDSGGTPRAGVTLQFKKFTDDGVHYFATMAKLKVWRRETMEQEAKEAYVRPPNPLLGLVGRDAYCEECEKGIPATTFCVDCNELYCAKCDELCHIMLDARNHLQYDYPLSGVHLRRFEAVKEAEDAKRAEQERKAAEEEEAARIAEERRHQEALEQYGWDPLRPDEAEEKVEVLTFPRFASNQRVLFKAIERSGGVAEVRGRIVPFKQGQLRRTNNGMFWYRVRYVDTSFPGDPRHERTELVKEKDLEDMDENERRKLCACINIIENHEVHEAWHTWRSLVDHLRRKDLEKFSATQIQRTWRGEMARTRVFLLRQEQAQKEALLRARIAKKQRKMERAARRLERQRLARLRGITTDGVHFFNNFHELYKWWGKRKRAAIAFKKLLHRHWFQHDMRRCLERWKNFINLKEEARVSEMDHLKRARALLLANERKAAIRRAKRMSMFKLKALSRLSGLRMQVSKVRRVPSSVHEEFHIEGTDRGVLKRIRTEQLLVKQHNAEAIKAGRLPQVDEDCGAERVSVAGDTDSDDEEKGHEGATPQGKDPEASLLMCWRYLGGRLETDGEDHGDLDETGAMQHREVHLKGARSVIFTRALYGDEREDKVPWHPAVDIRLPKLPYIGAHARADGTVRIEDINKFNTFKSAMQGPWDASHWLIKGMLCIGAYPEGQADATSRVVTSHSSAIAQLLMKGLDTFVCLMTDDEVERPNGVPYEDAIRECSRNVRSALFSALSASKVTSKRSSEAAKRAHNYARKIREKLEERARKDKALVRINAERLKRFPDKLNFITFPISEGQTAPDMHVIHLCENLEARLRLRENVYIFSRTGRGRAGTIAAVLMGRIYGMTHVDTMEYMARCNNAQRRQVMIPPRATRLPDAVSDLSLNHELIEARAREEAEKERKAAGKLKPIDPSSKLRDHKDNEFFGTSFSNFGRIRRRKEQARKEAAARRAKLLANKASKAKKAEEERVNSVLAKNYKATTCTPSTNVQKNQVRRLLTRTDVLYDSIATSHEEGTYSFKAFRRNHGKPVVLPSITQRDEIGRRETVEKANDRRFGGVGGVRLLQSGFINR